MMISASTRFRRAAFGSAPFAPRARPRPLAVTVGLASLVAAASLAAGPAAAADRAAGEKLANERCSACHGKDGNTPIDPSYPKLGGQYDDYLVAALKAYRADRRKNAIMGAQAKPLSNADIANVAAYYSSLPTQLGVVK